MIKFIKHFVAFYFCLIKKKKKMELIIWIYNKNNFKISNFIPKYAGVPTTDLLKDFSPMIRANPKSQSLTYNYISVSLHFQQFKICEMSRNRKIDKIQTWGKSESDDNNTFSGFKSQCTIFLKWRWRSADNIWNNRSFFFYFSLL